MKKVFSLVLSLLAATTMAFAVQETVECGKQVTLTATPATGYEFVEWQVDGARVSTNNPWLNVDASTTIYTAIFTATSYSITCDLVGGAVATANPTSYTIESAAITLNNPTKNGYDFSGWTGSNGTVAQTTVTIPAGSTGNKAYTANWSAIAYAIAYTLNGGDVATANPTSYTIESAAITLNNPTKNGYDFTGWTGSNGTAAQTSVTIAAGSTGDKNYTANWSIKSYAITYDLAGGAVATPNPTNYNIESAAITLNNPTKEGYDFAGWTGSNGSTPQTSVTIAAGSTEDKNYTANWTPKSYTISYDLAGGAVATANPTSYTIESAAITLNNPTRANYDFAGWTGSNGTVAQTTVTIPAGSTGDKSYTANWTLKKYTINFYINGNLAQTLQVEHGATPTYTGETAKEKPQDDGCDYTFDSWNPNLYAADKDQDYEAEFTCAPRSYTITFKNHDGTVTLQSTEVQYGTTPVFEGATPTKPDEGGKTFTFSGWRREGATADGIVPVDGPAIYHPQFTSENATYTVSVASADVTMGTVSGGGSGIVGTSVTITATANQCYEFVRWSDNNTEYTRTFTISGDATYTAYFKKTEYTVTANPDNATHGSVSITVQQ